jgi:hypothetical protein
MPDDVLTPLGELLEHAREKVLHISARQAAARAGISGTRWRQVVTGIAWRGGEATPVRSTARTVVAMALAVEVDPAEALKAAGIDATSEAVQAIVRDARTPKEPAAAGARPGLAEEIERIRGLPLDPDDKIRIANALIALYAERGAQAKQPREPAA